MKKRGFTLIELLAVIVILAIIALIATPAVLNIIEDSRKNSVEASARNISKAAENYYAQYTLLHKENVGQIDVTDNTLSYKGKKPYKGKVYFDDNGNAYIKMYQDGYCVVGDYDNKTEAEKMDAEDCKINSIIIFMDLDGGTLDIPFLEYEQGDTFGDLPTPTKEGYEFHGWFDKDGYEIMADTVIDQSCTIYAYWDAKAYTVTLSFPNETIPETEGWKVINEVPTKEITFDTEYGILPEPTKTGYTFKGWYTSNQIKIESNSILKIPNNHVLTGKYDPNKYQITFVYNNGDANTYSTVTYDETYNLSIPTKTGYTFSGWYDGNTKIENNSVVKVLENKVFEAKWEANTYTVTFVYDNGNANTTSQVVFDESYNLPTPTKDGYIFQGWFTTDDVSITSESKVTIASDHTLAAKWSVNGYTVTFNANGGSVSPTSDSVTYDAAYGELPTPSRTGYTFDGWYTLASGGTQVTDSTIVKTAGNHSIYAHWKAKTYTVTFVYGNGNSNTTATVTYNENYSLSTPTKTGYIFAGWATTGGVVVTNSTKVTTASDHTLTAQWTAITYKIVYDSNGGSGSMSTITHTYDVAKALTANAFTRSGYEFIGWNTVKGGTGTSYTNKASVKNLSSTNGATVTLYAQWKASYSDVTPSEYTMTCDSAASYTISGSVMKFTNTSYDNNCTAGYSKSGTKYIVSIGNYGTRTGYTAPGVQVKVGTDYYWLFYHLYANSSGSSYFSNYGLTSGYMAVCKNGDDDSCKETGSNRKAAENAPWGTFTQYTFEVSGTTFSIYADSTLVYTDTVASGAKIRSIRFRPTFGWWNSGSYYGQVKGLRIYT